MLEYYTKLCSNWHLLDNRFDVDELDKKIHIYNQINNITDMENVMYKNECDELFYKKKMCKKNSRKNSNKKKYHKKYNNNNNNNNNSVESAVNKTVPSKTVPKNVSKKQEKKNKTNCKIDYLANSCIKNISFTDKCYKNFDDANKCVTDYVPCVKSLCCRNTHKNNKYTRVKIHHKKNDIGDDEKFIINFHNDFPENNMYIDTINNMKRNKMILNIKESNNYSCDEIYDDVVYTYNNPGCSSIYKKYACDEIYDDDDHICIKQLTYNNINDFDYHYNDDNNDDNNDNNNDNEYHNNVNSFNVQENDNIDKHCEDCNIVQNTVQNVEKTVSDNMEMFQSNHSFAVFPDEKTEIKKINPDDDIIGKYIKNGSFIFPDDNNNHNRINNYVDRYDDLDMYQDKNLWKFPDEVFTDNNINNNYNSNKTVESEINPDDDIIGKYIRNGSFIFSDDDNNNVNASDLLNGNIFDEVFRYGLDRYDSVYGSCYDDKKYVENMIEHNFDTNSVNINANNVDSGSECMSEVEYRDDMGNKFENAIQLVDSVGSLASLSDVENHNNNIPISAKYMCAKKVKEYGIIRDEIKRIVNNLCVIKNIKVGEKLWLYEKDKKIEIDNGLFRGLYRWYYEQNRQKTIQFIMNDISDAKNIIEEYGCYDNKDSDMEELKKVINEVRYGINNMMVTYIDCIEQLERINEML